MYKSTGRKAVDVAYPQNVEVIERLVGLYGENVILDAMINNTDNLEQLMAIDSAKYEELRGLMDDYHNQVYYNANGLHAGDAVRTVEAQERYNKIQGFIQDIEDRRKIEDKDIPIQEDGSKIGNWFKNFKNKLNNIFSFSKKDKSLLLNASPSDFKVNDRNDNLHKNDKLRESIKVSAINLTKVEPVTKENKTIEKKMDER